MAKVFNHRGVRSINELPTASMGEATSPRAATSIPIVTARPPDNKPMIAPRRREGEDRSEVCCCGASGSTSGPEGDEVVKLIRQSIQRDQSECRVEQEKFSATSHGGVVACLDAGVPLTWTADLLIFVAKQFLPVSQPTNCAWDGKQNSEH